MDSILELVLFDEENDGEMVGVEEYLRLRRTGQIDWEPSLEDSGLSLVCGDNEWLLDYWNTGQINLLVLQLEKALERLGRNEEAILRIGTIDSIGGPYLLFTPEGEDVAVSLFLVDDPELDLCYPIEDVIGSPSDLYGYVNERREALLAKVGGVADRKYFKNVRCPKESLLKGLAHAAQQGRELYDALGHTVDRSVY